jgi:hypothetical protein
MAGAWPTYTAADGKPTKWYLRTKPWTIFANGSPRAYGVVAIKRELLARGFTADGFRTDSPVLGDSADGVIREFQAAQSLVVDGVVGPNTTEHLFAQLISTRETNNEIPDRLAARLVKLESSEDPGAIGWSDPNDKGLCEINVVKRPVTIPQAFDPRFAIMYLCGDLAGAFADLHDWEAALASWNVGEYWASHWLNAGKPSSGAWDPKNNVDWYTRAQNYVMLVGTQNLIV